jgi:hypothetical protein
MPTERRSSLHSDLAPSSKDWQPGSPGRDEDFTPEKDLWTRSRKGGVGEGRPGEDIRSAAPEGARQDIQPGTAKPGKSWTSDTDASASDEEKLDDAVADTFPASDPPAATDPATGWVTNSEAEERAGGKKR